MSSQTTSLLDLRHLHTNVDFENLTTKLNEDGHACFFVALLEVHHLDGKNTSSRSSKEVKKPLSGLGLRLGRPKIFSIMNVRILSFWYSLKLAFVSKFPFGRMSFSGAEINYKMREKT